MPAWSKPYYGVQHLLGVPRSHQITVNDYGTFSEVYMLHLHGMTPFTDVRREQYDTPEQARKAGESWATILKSGVPA